MRSLSSKRSTRRSSASIPGATVIAEESTAWPGVSRPTYLGGLGFGFKWNMGWMHDTLDYFHHDPVYRRYHHGELTFGLLYAWSENFILPLSHDEVVHGKGSLLNKMPGDRWQQLANLRALYAWMWAHPGKQLLFMGGELGQEREWSHDRQLDWWILDQWADHRRLRSHGPGAQPGLPGHAGPVGGRRRPGGLRVDRRQRRRPERAVVPAPARRGAAAGDAVACVANLTPVPRYGYRVGLPAPGPVAGAAQHRRRRVGRQRGRQRGAVEAEDVAWHGQPWSAAVTLPPLGVLWLAPG